MTIQKIVPIHHFTVVLKLPRDNDSYLTRAKGIYKSVINTSNFPVFPTGSAALTSAIFNADIAAFDTAESNLKTKPPLGTTEQRDVAKAKVVNDLEYIRLGVQALVNANPANAAVIAANAGMEVKVISGNHGTQSGSATPGEEPNSWNVKDVGPGPHEWRISSDGKTWTPLPATRGQKTLVSNLTRGLDYTVQSRQMLPFGKYSEWSIGVIIHN